MDTPPPWTDIGKHDLLPQAAHDEIARFNFLANLNKFMANHVVGGNRVAYDKRVKPAFRSAHGRDPRDRREIRDAMRGDPYYQMWSCLRRNTMEMRQQAGRSLVLRQAEALRDRVRERNAQAPDSLKLQAVPLVACQPVVLVGINGCIVARKRERVRRLAAGA